MNKFDRIISILILLQTKKRITASFIAGRFETSLRTIYRDINTLKSAGIPVIGDPGIGYSIMEGYRLPPVMFNEGEALSLLTAEKFMANTVDYKTHQHYSDAMTKIKAILRSSEKQALDVLNDSITITRYKSEKHKPYLQDLFKSIASFKVLKISYQKADGTSSNRIVEPLGCYHQSNFWYLVGFCQEKCDYRTFKINRIQDLIILDETFKKHKINLQNYLEEQARKRKEKQQAKVIEVFFHSSVVQFANLRKYYFGVIDEVEKENGVTMKFWSYSTEVMARWLMQFTNKATILQPEILRDRIKELSVELYDHYNPSSTIK